MLACRNVGRQLLVGAQVSPGEPFGGGRSQLDLPGGRSATMHTQEEPEPGAGLRWPVADVLGMGRTRDAGTLHKPSMA